MSTRCAQTLAASVALFQKPTNAAHPTAAPRQPAPGMSPKVIEKCALVYLMLLIVVRSFTRTVVSFWWQRSGECEAFRVTHNRSRESDSANLARRNFNRFSANGWPTPVRTRETEVVPAVWGIMIFGCTEMRTFDGWPSVINAYVKGGMCMLFQRMNNRK